MDEPQVSLSESSGATIVTIQARELVEHTVNVVRPQLLRLLSAGPARCVVHLAQTEFVASAGIGLIVQLAHKLSTTGGRLAVCTPRIEILRLFKGPPHFLGSVSIHSDLQEAIRAVAPQ